MDFQYLYGSVFGGFSSLMWFSFLFMIGGYLKRFGCPEWLRHRKGAILLGIWGALTLMDMGLTLIKEEELLLSAPAIMVLFFSIS